MKARFRLQNVWFVLLMCAADGLSIFHRRFVFALKCDHLALVFRQSQRGITLSGWDNLLCLPIAGVTRMTDNAHEKRRKP
jgi:hypothetical protein